MPSAGAPDASSPLLTVEPASALLDEPVVIRLTGLVPGEDVTLTATMTDHFDRHWQSEATFIADRAGVVEVSTQAPIAGSYEGAEPMGLFWSMTPEALAAHPCPSVHRSHSSSCSRRSPRDGWWRRRAWSDGSSPPA